VDSRVSRQSIDELIARCLVPFPSGNADWSKTQHLPHEIRRTLELSRLVPATITHDPDPQHAYSFTLSDLRPIASHGAYLKLIRAPLSFGAVPALVVPETPHSSSGFFE
jgi:hypothetical protein